MKARVHIFNLVGTRWGLIFKVKTGVKELKWSKTTRLSEDIETKITPFCLLSNFGNSHRCYRGGFSGDIVEGLKPILQL